MTKKAVLAAVNTYPLPADSLEAPVKEAGRWARLLSYEYGFGQNVVTLFEGEATRQRLLQELRLLLKGAKERDHLVFGFWGHGGHSRGWRSDTELNDKREHALILYAGADGSQGFQHATLTPSDIARIVSDAHLPATVRFTIIVDSCFAAGFGGGGGRNTTAALEMNPTVLFIENAVKDLRSDQDVVTFADIGRMIGDTTIAHPLIVAAADIHEPAHEIGETNYRRLAFSERAENRLLTAFDVKSPISSQMLVDDINPISRSQTATIIGEASIAAEPFAGGLRPNAKASVTSAAMSGVTDTTVGSSFTMRVIGMATLINLKSDKLPYRNRIVCPLDTYATTNAKKHQAFIEVADRDMVSPPAGVPAAFEYLRAGVKYSRWILSEHVVRFANVLANGVPVQQSADFLTHVPSLPVISPTLDPVNPRLECFRDYPIPTLFTGFIDLEAGYADIGELETHKTIFRGRYTGIPTWGKPDGEHTPISVLFTIPLTDNYTVITIRAKDYRSVIYLRAGSMILAGNAREADITGPGSGEGPSEHFLICYNLAPEVPLDAGLPQRVTVPINACTVTRWP